nr:immunoglobulin heavy chain junction region [Mus musculus]
ITVQTDGYYLL